MGEFGVATGGGIWVAARVGVIVIELLWRGHEKREERNQRKTQLRHIKSYMFHARLQDLFRDNFNALEEPSSITLKNCFSTEYPKSDQGVEELRQSLRYKDKVDEKMAKAIHEYVKAEDVWREFQNLAVMFNFGMIVGDMTEILHLVADVKRMIPADESLDRKLQALTENLRQDANQKLKKDLEKIMKDGILKFWNYADELRRKDQKLFSALKESYNIN
jgi:hypothetical protein